MATRYISYAQQDTYLERGDMVDEERKNAANYLDDHLSGHSIGKWYFGRTIEVGDKTENEFRKAVLDYLHENAALVNEEVVVIGHGQAFWGYGSLDDYIIDGKRFWGALVYAGNKGVGKWENRIMTWHEIAHAFDAHHKHGHYTVGSNGYNTDIMPMGTSYTYDEDGDVDSSWEGNNNAIPDTFDCGSLPNYANENNGFFQEDHHVRDRYSSCALGEMQDWMDSNL